MSTLELTLRDIEDAISHYRYILQILEWQRGCFQGLLNKSRANRTTPRPQRHRLRRICFIITYAARDVWREVRGR